MHFFFYTEVTVAFFVKGRKICPTLACAAVVKVWWSAPFQCSYVWWRLGWLASHTSKHTHSHTLTHTHSRIHCITLYAQFSEIFQGQRIIRFLELPRFKRLKSKIESRPHNLLRGKGRVEGFGWWWGKDGMWTHKFKQKGFNFIIHLERRFHVKSSRSVDRSFGLS